MSNNPNIPPQSSSQTQGPAVSGSNRLPPKPAIAPPQTSVAKPAAAAQPPPLKPSFEGEGWKPLPKKLKIFGNLLSEVVNKGICMYCGACIASCPIDILFHSDKEEPIMRGTCAVCQVCYYSCPRIELPLSDVERRVFGRERRPEEAILGINIGRYSAMAKDPELHKAAQDGGVGTALLLYALERKIIDYAVVSGYSFKDPYRPEPQIASTREDLIKTAGSRYTPGGQVGGLGEIAIPNRGSTNSQEERLAVVGLPCELQGMWRMTTHWIATPKLAKNVVFTMGLFCSKVFDYQKMMVDYVQGKRGIDLRTITKVNVKKARLLVHVGEKLVIDEPVEAVAFSAREECNVCIDYSAELADIAIGAVGSATGWTTILTRTPRGEEIVNAAANAGYIQLKPLSEKGLRFVEKLCMMKRRRDPSVYMRNETSVPKPEPSLVTLEVPVK